jgi:hypothetical protein
MPASGAATSRAVWSQETTEKRDLHTWEGKIDPMLAGGCDETTPRHRPSGQIEGSGAGFPESPERAPTNKNNGHARNLSAFARSDKR